MAVVAKASSYLIRRAGIYYFRMTIPPNLRTYFGRRELRCSLKTGYLKIARNHARRIAAVVHEVFKEVKEQPGKYSREYLAMLINKTMRRVLDHAEERFFSQGAIDESKIEEKRQRALEMYDTLKQNLSRRDFEIIDPDVAEFVEGYNLDIEEESAEYRQLRFMLMKMFVQVADIYVHRSSGDFDYERKYVDQNLVGNSQTDSKLSDVISLYCQEREISGSWSDRTRDEVERMLSNLVEILGDAPMATLNYSKLREFKKVFLQLPPNRNKLKKYKGLPVSKILDMKPAKTISTRTFNNVITWVASFLDYAVKHGYISENYADGLAIKTRTRENEHREVFSDQDIRNIFSSEIVRRPLHPWMLWIPLLALYTGARLEEIAQAHVADIVQEDGVWCLDINDEGEKRVKNPSAVRLVPLHPDLIEKHGFLDYVEKVRSRGKMRLFPELKRQAGRYGHAVSRWFGRNKSKFKLTGKKTFHSFRHTFINHLKQQGVPEHPIAEMVGHKLKGITFGVYGKPYGAKQLHDQLVMLVNFAIGQTISRSVR